MTSSKMREVFFLLTLYSLHDEIPGGGLWHFQSYFPAREIDGISPSKTDWTTAVLAVVQSVLEGEIPSISRAEK